jgi:hypothetical protein
MGAALLQRDPLISTLRARVTDFLSEPKALELSYPRRAIHIASSRVLQRITERGWSSYLVGGTLRDLLLGPARAGPAGSYPRDIDIIVIGASLQELAECFSDLLSRQTRYGGLHLVTHVTRTCEVHFDVWPLDETWAFKEYALTPDIAIFPTTPFLNIDAIAVEARAARGRPRQVYEHGFFDAIGNELLDVNFEPNPYPDVCAMRALVLAAKLKYGISTRLGYFIAKRAAMSSVSAFEDAQLSHYGRIRCTASELTHWIEEISQQLHRGADRIELPIPQYRQLELWVDYPVLGPEDNIPDDNLVKREGRNQ